MPIERPVYLDHHATTPCDPRVVEAMMPTFSEVYGNAASSQHAVGRRARQLVEEARSQVASFLNCQSEEVVFTSGATEADNLAVKGVALRAARRRGGRAHILTTAIEHRAVLDSCQSLENLGFRVSYLPCDSEGLVGVEEVSRALADDTVLVSVMYANNEIGTIQPIREIGELCRERGIHLHTDAVQAAAHLDCDVQRLSVDLLSLSAHKMYGPKGVGALFVRRRGPRVRLRAQMDGGGHERGRRSGSLNVPGIVGLGEACRLVQAARERERQRVSALRDRMLEGLLRELPGTLVNGSLRQRLPNNINVSLSPSLAGVTAERLLERLEDVAISSGSACSSATSDGSYVIRILRRGTDPQEVEALAARSLRIGLGRGTTAEGVDFALSRIVQAVRDLASSTPSDSPAGDACSAVCPRPGAESP